jgi:2-dehydropantoate 2-reductase
MKILVYGAGPLGSLFAGRLHEAGYEVSLLERGQRLVDLREHGVVLVDTQTDQETVASVNIVERLEPDKAYDLVLVIMRKNRVAEILPDLAANCRTPNILFLMNNAAGSGELVNALGRERVILGFPMSAGYRRGHVIYYLVGAQPGKKAMIPIGEVDGRITPRLLEVGRILANMPGFGVDFRTDMDAWLKTHAALLMPSLAPALRAAGRDSIRMVRTRDLFVLAIRAIREGFSVLRALGIPITPNTVRKFGWIPEPILVWGFQRRLMDPRIRVALLEHAEAAQDEVKHLADEFLVLAHQTTVPTPAMDRLFPYFDPATPLMPEGSAEIPLDWRGVWIGLVLLAGISGLVWLQIKHVRSLRGVG